MLNCQNCGGKRWLAKIDKKTGLQLKHHIVVDGEVEYDLRIWKCWRCGNVQEEERPFIPLHKRARANILYIDLEVSKSAFYNYGPKVSSKFIRADDLIYEYFIICWSASYLGNDTIWSECVTTDEVKAWRDGTGSPDKRILSRLQELMASADIIAGHNVDKYDVKRSNTRFLINGLTPVIEKKTLDTLKIARTKFAFEYNGLDYISQKLGLRGKDEITNDDWLRIVKTGDEATLRRVLKYNRGDVRNGKGVLKELMDYSGKKADYGSITPDGSPQYLRA